jgi:hypothetical protein
MSTSWGTAAEEGARRFAADLGVKDFVYGPVTVPKGQATREVSDGILIVGDRGLILQTKARDPGAADDDVKLRNWATRKVREAVRQVRGTRNTLESQSVRLRSLRGHERSLDAPHSWPGVVLLALDRVPSGININIEDNRTVVMTLSDWCALHHMVLSTSGVIEYVERVIQGSVSADLGDESTRYHKYAQADANHVNLHGGYPVLPRQLVEGQERVYAEMIDEWIDSDIGVSHVEAQPDDPDRVRRTVEILDSIPILLRVEIGKLLADRIRDSSITHEPRCGLIWIEGTRDRILFYADVAQNWPNFEKDVEPHLFCYTAVRHEQLNETRGEGATLLLGRIALEGRSVWRTFVMMNGAVDPRFVPAGIRWAINQRYGVLTADETRDIESFDEDEPCPCGSGELLGRCNPTH